MRNGGNHGRLRNGPQCGPYKLYASDKAAAQDLISIGDHPVDSTIEPAELAAWTSVETFTRY
jgi:hypothetical protein